MYLKLFLIKSRQLETIGTVGTVGDVSFCTFWNNWGHICGGLVYIILKYRVSDQTSVSECDWSNLLSLKDLSFNISGCDTQGMKNNVYLTFPRFGLNSNEVLKKVKKRDFIQINFQINPFYFYYSFYTYEFSILGTA